MRAYKYLFLYVVTSIILMWAAISVIKVWVVLSLIISAISGALWGVSMSVFYFIMENKKLPSEISEILDIPFCFKLYKYCVVLFMATCFIKYLLS